MMATTKQVLVKGVVKEVRDVAPQFTVLALEDGEYTYDLWVKGAERKKVVAELKPGQPVLAEVYFKSRSRTVKKGDEEAKTRTYCQPYLFALA